MELIKSRLHVTSEMITGIEDCMPSLSDDMSNADNNYYLLKIIEIGLYMRNGP